MTPFLGPINLPEGPMELRSMSLLDHRCGIDGCDPGAAGWTRAWGRAWGGHGLPALSEHHRPTPPCVCPTQKPSKPCPF